MQTQDVIEDILNLIFNIKKISYSGNVESVEYKIFNYLTTPININNIPSSVIKQFMDINNTLVLPKICYNDQIVSSNTKITKSSWIWFFRLNYLNSLSAIFACPLLMVYQIERKFLSLSVIYSTTIKSYGSFENENTTDSYTFKQDFILNLIKALSVRDQHSCRNPKTFITLLTNFDYCIEIDLFEVNTDKSFGHFNNMILIPKTLFSIKIENDYFFPVLPSKDVYILYESDKLTNDKFVNVKKVLTGSLEPFNELIGNISLYTHPNIKVKDFNVSEYGHVKTSFPLSIIDIDAIL